MKNLEEKIKEIATRQDNCDLLDDCHYHDDTVKQILALLKSDREELIKKVEGYKCGKHKKLLSLLKEGEHCKCECHRPTSNLYEEICGNCEGEKEGVE